MTGTKQTELSRQQKVALAEVLAHFIETHGFTEGASGVVAAIECLFPTPEEAAETVKQVEQIAEGMNPQGVARGGKRIYR